MPTAKIPRRREAALEAVTTLTARMVSLRRLTSAVREGAFAVVVSLALPDASLRGRET